MVDQVARLVDQMLVVRRGRIRGRFDDFSSFFSDFCPHFRDTTLDQASSVGSGWHFAHAGMNLLHQAIEGFGDRRFVWRGHAVISCQRFVNEVAEL